MFLHHHGCWTTWSRSEDNDRILLLEAMAHNVVMELPYYLSTLADTLERFKREKGDLFMEGGSRMTAG